MIAPIPTTSSSFLQARQAHFESTRLTLAALPASVWLDENEVASLLQDSLANGNGFDLPLAQIDHWSGTDCHRLGQKMRRDIRAGFISNFPTETNPAAAVTAWELFENFAHNLDLRSALLELQGRAIQIAHDLAQETRAVSDLLEDFDVARFETKLAATLETWIQSSLVSTPAEARLDFIGCLNHHLFGSFDLPASIWQIFLLRFEIKLTPPKGAKPLSTYLAPAFRCLWDSLSIQPAIHAFWKLNADADPQSSRTLEQITVLASITRSSGRDASELKASINLNWCQSDGLSAAQSDIAWRAALRDGLERAFSEPLENAADLWLNLQDAENLITAKIAPLTPALKRIGDDLAQGMQGRDTNGQITDLGYELLFRGLWTGLISTNPAEAQAIFLTPVVRELGLDPIQPCWRKHQRMGAALQQLLTGQTNEPAWRPVGLLLRALESRAVEITASPLNWSKDSGDIDSKFDREIASISPVILRRLAVTCRLVGAARATNSMTMWYQREILDNDHNSPHHASAEQWLRAAESGFSDSLENETLHQVADSFGRSLPRLMASWKLSQHSETIATRATEQVMSRLPEYAHQIDSAGRESCIRDNALTLNQVSTLLIADVEEPAETLADWWNSAVGNYLANRPNQLFETNLTALFHAIGTVLDDAERKYAFDLIQSVYRDTLGIECLEARAGSPTSRIGPLRRLKTHEPVPLPLPDLSEISTLIANHSTPLDAPIETSTALATAFHTYTQELATGANQDIAAGSVFPILRSSVLPLPYSRYAPVILDIASSPTVNTAGVSLFLGEAADGFVDILGQLDFAHVLSGEIPAIASAYSEAMIAFDGGLFAHLSVDEALTRCHRDQSLLLTMFAQRLLGTSASLFWIDSTRWYLELLAPFVNYPAHVWKLSARTVAKHLGPKLEAAGAIFLSRWVSHFEHLAEVWTEAGPLGPIAFHPGDYSFSARPAEDRLSRDLVAACITASASGHHSSWHGEQLLTRFLMSWSGSTLSDSALVETVANIHSVRGLRISARCHQLLAAVPQMVADLKSSASRSDPSTDRLLTLCRGDSDTIRFWGQARELPLVEISRPLAHAALRSHLLFLPSKQGPRGLSSPFLNAGRERVGRVAIILGCEIPATTWDQVATSLLNTSPHPNTLRSHFHSLQREWPAITAGVSLQMNAEEQVTAFLNQLHSEKDYRGKADQCHEATNQLAFAYVIRQTAAALWDPCSCSPRLFFDLAGENHRKINPTVAAQAHTRTKVFLRQILPSGHARVAQTLASIESASWSPMGDMWVAIGSGDSTYTPAYIDAFFDAIRPVAADAVAFSPPSDSSVAENLIIRAEHYLEALACELSDSGDPDAAWEVLLAELSADLPVIGPDVLLNIFYGATRSVGDHLPLGAAAFWRQFLIATTEVVRQAALGHHLESRTAELGANCATGIKDKTLQNKCARDQAHLLAAISDSLCHQAPARAWLNIGTSITELVLPHLSHSGIEISQCWRQHESSLFNTLPACLRPALWQWFGAWQRFSLNLPSIRPLSIQVVPTVATELTEEFGQSHATWRHFLAGLAAASISPDAGPSSAEAALGKLILSQTLTDSNPDLDWAVVSTRISDRSESLLPGRVPQSWKRLLLALPRVTQRLRDLKAIGGSRIVRFCGAQPHHPLAASLWQTSLLARARPEERIVESDPADAIAAQALASSIESDETVLTRLSHYRATHQFASQAQLVPGPNRGGFLSRIGLGPKSLDWINHPSLREQADDLGSTLVLQLLTGNSTAMSWYLGCPLYRHDSTPEFELGVLKFYDSLALHARSNLELNHPLATALASFATSLPQHFAGLRLLGGSDTSTLPLALTVLEIRRTNEFPGRNPQDDPFGPLVTRATGKTSSLTTTQKEHVQRAHASLLRPLV